MVYKSVCVALVGLGVFLLRRVIRRKTVFCRSKASIDGKIAIVTGGTNGVGRAAAFELARRHCQVILACRSKQLGDETAMSINKLTKDKRRATVIPVDLSSLQSVRHFVDILHLHSETFPRIDILVNNAGVFEPPTAFTEDGIESHFGVNHIGHFLLTSLLLEREMFSQNARIITVASSLANRADISKLDYSKLYDDAFVNLSPNILYANSKLANCLFSRELHRRYGSTRSLFSMCVHTDGMVRTNLFRHVIAKWSALLRPFLHFLAWFLLRSPEEGCQTLLHCAVSPEHELSSGSYYGNCAVQPWPVKACDDELSERIWRISQQLCDTNSK